MRSNVLLLLFTVCSLLSSAQSRTIDSLRQLLNNTSQDTNRIKILTQLSRLYLYESPLTGISLAEQALELSDMLNYEAGKGAALNAMGYSYRMTGSYNKALKNHLEALRIFEKLHDEEGMAYAYHGISTLYEDQEIFKESLEYAHMVIPIAHRIGNKGLLMRIQSNMGRSFEIIDQLDSALYYEQNAYEIALETKDSTILGNILSRLGNIYYKMGNKEMAHLYYKMGLPIAIKRNDNNSIYELNYSLARLFQNDLRYDSSVFYGKMALITAQKYNSPSAVASSVSLLSETFDRLGTIDSAYKYQAIAIATKDTLITREKVRQMQLMAFDEESRQKELAVQKLKSEKFRMHQLEFVVVGVTILIVLIAFLLLSSTIIVNARFITFLGAMALLLFFEFINLLLHPFLENMTDHSPALMLVALVLIAAILVPLHHRLEKWVKVKMVEKNKRIRLAAAKKTIADLESETDIDGTTNQ